MKVILKIVLGLIAIMLFLSASFPNFSRVSHGINFINLDKEKVNVNNNVGAAIVEAQIQKFKPNENLEPYDGKVPVLMYHVIGNEFYKEPNENTLKKESFEEQMKWLSDNGYNTITPDQLYDFVKNKAPLPPKPIILSFDDGNIDSYTNVFPLLKKYNFTATMFIITKAIGSNGRVNEDQIRDMLEYGVTIGSHTQSHLDLTTLSKDEMRKEIIDSKSILENKFGVPINFLCYPAGRYDDMVLSIVKEANYLGAFTTHFGRVGYGDDTKTFVRVRINRSDSLNGFIQKIEHAKTLNFSTPHHGDKKNKLPLDNGEIGLGNDNKKNKQKNKDKTTTDKNTEQPKTTDNSNGNQTNNNNSGNTIDNNTNSQNPSNGNTQTGTGSDSTSNGGIVPNNNTVGAQSISPSQMLLKRITKNK